MGNSRRVYFGGLFAIHGYHDLEATSTMRTYFFLGRTVILNSIYEIRRWFLSINFEQVDFSGIFEK